MRYYFSAMRLLLLIVYWSLFTAHCFSQPGVWQTHFSYRSAQSVAVVGQNVYAATRNGFFRYNKTTSETRLLTRDDGLSDVSISRVLALPDQSRLLLAYRSGSIDFLTVNATGEPRDILTINTITTSDRIPASFRGINHINRAGNTAYLSTDFGLVIFDLSRNEIRDTYFSPVTNGTPTSVLMTAILGDSLYALARPNPMFPAATTIQAVRLSQTTNIADPANWRPSQGFTADGFLLNATQLVTDKGRLLASTNAVAGGKAGGIYSRTPTTANMWSLLQRSTNQAGVFSNSTGASTFIQTVINESVLTVPGSTSYTGPLLQNPREVIPDGNLVWVADTTSGLLETSSAGFRRVAPEGPFADSFQNLFAYANQLVALPGDNQQIISVPDNKPDVEQFDVSASHWTSNPLANLAQSFNSAAYLPTERQLFLGSYGGGLWSQTEGQTPGTTTIQRVTTPSLVSPLVTALATDPSDNLWIGDRASSSGASLHVRRPNGQFESFARLGSLPIAQIVPDDYGTLWLRLTYGVLLAFNPATGQQRYFSTIRGDGNLPSNNVTAIVRDRNGLIWVGTDRGVTVFDDPSQVFIGNVSANTPIFDSRRLLATETITAMTVDGGNRKWIATESALYRFGPDGTTLDSRFTPSDSPLPSSTINALAIEPGSGRVFISTAGGLVSYGGVATEPSNSLTGITIFPNPVRPDFAGLVGIRGLTDNAVVKILDAAGQLVYETRAQGGTATWNLLDYRGRSAQTGIYLVVVLAANGEEGIAGKLAVVR